MKRALAERAKQLAGGHGMPTSNGPSEPAGSTVSSSVSRLRAPSEEEGELVESQSQSQSHHPSVTNAKNLLTARVASSGDGTLEPPAKVPRIDPGGPAGAGSAPGSVPQQQQPSAPSSLPSVPRIRVPSPRPPQSTVAGAAHSAGAAASSPSGSTTPAAGGGAETPANTPVPVRPPSSSSSARSAPRAVAAAVQQPRPSPRSSHSAKRRRPASGGTTPTGGGSTPRASSAAAAAAASSTPPAYESVVKSDDEESEVNSSSLSQKNSFYLRLQNRALASELRAYKRQIDLLTSERDWRRIQCREAREGVDKLGECWGEVEGGLRIGLGEDIQSAAVKQEQQENDVTAEGQDADIGEGPASTGTGDEVESVRSLVASLVRLADAPSVLPPSREGRIKSEDAAAAAKGEGGDGMDVDAATDDSAAQEDDEQHWCDHHKAQSSDMADAAARIAARAETFRDHLLILLRRVLSDKEGGSAAALASAVESTATAKPENDPDPLEPSQLRRKLIASQNEVGERDSRISELIRAREEAKTSERRVRRGLYRLASGRMKVDEVITAVEKEDGKSLFDEFAEEDAAHLAAMSGLSTPAGMMGAVDALTSPAVASAPGIGPVPGGMGADGEGAPIDSAELSQLKKKLQDLEEIADSREKRISDLLMEREDHIKQINDLRLPKTEDSVESITVDDIKRSDLYTETATKLATAEAHGAELKAAFEDVMKRWAVAKGDLDLAKKTVEEMEEKHIRRMEEVATTGIVPDQESSAAGKESKCNGSVDDEEKDDGSEKSSHVADAKKVVELEHKLRQALEYVRQAETTRVSLAEASQMNEQLQAKLEELKTKNATLVASKSAARASTESSAALGDSHTSSSHKPLTEKEKVQQEKLQRVRKELAAARVSKDGAKAKQDRAEKELYALMKTNSRLLAQSTEKDDMNARSLSTILHLNQLTEQLSSEKEISEQKAKAAEQLSLAARLAANAKERVHEEAVREKEVAEKELEQTKERLNSLLVQKAEADGRLSQSKHQIVSVVKDLSTARGRCDELAKESTTAEEEKSRLMDTLAVTKKEAVEATKVAALAAASMSSGRSGGDVNSEFTMEQMETQVKVLKGRLACNVCNERDKNTILLRCRHMFCRPCVDKNIKNRSRKCPGCAQRFDMKDVGDVWL